MNKFYKGEEYLRKYFGKSRIEVAIPSLSKAYENSFYQFLQPDINTIERNTKGLEKILKSVFPIEVKRLSNYNHVGYLTKINFRDIYFYSHYIIIPPSHKEEMCISKGLSYTTTIYIVTYKLTLRDDQIKDDLNTLDITNLNGLKKHVSIFPIRNFPLITSKGTFIINGIERTIVSQLQRSPGIYHTVNKRTLTEGLRIIPYYGTKIELEEKRSDKNPFEIRFYKKRIPFWTFLESLGITIEEILSVYFNNFFVLLNSFKKQYISFNFKNLYNGYVWKEIKDPITNQILLKEGDVVTLEKLKLFYNCEILNEINNKNIFKLKSNFYYHPSLIVKKYYWYDSTIPKLARNYIEKQRSIIVERFENNNTSNSLESFNQMILKIIKNNYSYKKEDRYRYLQKTLLDPLYYSISSSGRRQINRLFNYPKDSIFDYPILTKLDLLSLINYHLWRKDKLIELDNLYNIQNRKVRMAGELFGHLILKTFVNIKKKKNYFGKASLFGKPKWKLHHQLPLFIKTRISKLFTIFDMLKIEHRLLDHYINNRIYVLTDFEERLYKYVLYQVKQEIDHFLTGSDLSQLLDKLNPLAELTHIRRISLLGPDGLQRENVSMDTRDVQFSYFGRICPIETPEGKSVGIVNSLTSLSIINNNGNICSPYIVVEDGQLKNQVHYLDGEQEYYYNIALSEVIKSDGSLPENQLIYCRYKGSYLYISREKVNYVDVAPFHILSISSALIPFIEHNDGNRALMGANMQRQAVPSIINEIPFIGTGLEYTAGKESSILNIKESTSLLVDHQNIIYLSSDNNVKNLNNIQTRSINNLYNIHSYDAYYTKRKILVDSIPNKYSFNCSLEHNKLDKYLKNSQKTYTHYTTDLKKGGRLKSGSIIANHIGVDKGEIAIGHNILVGFMSMNGYSFEDSIVISDRLHKDGLYSSVHTKEFIAFDWETYKTRERITRKIPNVHSRYLEHLDSSGVIRVSTPLKGNDILIGKILVDRKEKSFFTDRDRFLHKLIAGEGLNKDYIKNTSKKAPKDMQGYVIDIKKYFFSTGDIPELLFRKEKDDIIINYYSYNNKLWILDQYLISQLAYYFSYYLFGSNDTNFSFIKFSNSIFKEYLINLKNENNKKNISEINKVILAFLVYYKNQNNQILYKTNFTNAIREEKLWRVFNKYTRIFVKMRKLDWLIFVIKLLQNESFIQKLGTHNYIQLKKTILNYIIYKYSNKKNYYQNHREILKKVICYNAPNFPIRLVKILIAYKHIPKNGDKMTGRHGNKGVISQVLPMVDMPFMSDGTPLDIILNPIGISSRMNLGQVLEVHLGWAATLLGKKILSMIQKITFDSSHQDLKSYLYHLYQHTKERSLISKLTNKEIYKLASKLSRATLISTSSFVGANENDIQHFMQLANINLRGQTFVFDGKTGEKYDHPITVGYMYILKLNHLVDEKIHTRFTGPYHRITEQPLGGKSRNGGQRFGEMEVWALQAYGAAYTLVDMMTFKSDLKKMHGFPEAFNVLVRELLALGFGIYGRIK